MAKLKDYTNPTTFTPKSSTNITQGAQSPAPKSYDQVIHTSPLGQNDTVIYNSATGQYRVQTRTPGSNQIVEHILDPGMQGEQSTIGAQTYSGSNDAQTRAMADQAKANDAQVAAEKAKLNPAPNATPEQISNVGQYDPNIINDPNSLNTTASIQQNVNKRIMENPFTGLQPGENLAARTGQVLINSPNKLTALVNKIPFGIGPGIVDTLGQDEQARLWLQDYSNEQNYKKVEDNINLAKTKITLALREANSGQPTDEAIQTYNDAWSQLAYSISQLKIIEQGDQRAYVEDIKAKRIELENYFQYFKTDKDNQMRQAIIKPNPTWQQTQDITGGAP